MFLCMANVLLQSSIQLLANSVCVSLLQVGIGLTPPKADAVQSVVEFGYAMPSGNETLPNEVGPGMHSTAN